MAEETRLPDPVVVDFVLCDGISRDLSTGKLSLLGLMSAVRAPEVPTRVTFAVFAKLTNVRESVPLHFRIVDEEGETIVQSLETQLPKPDDILTEVVSLVYFPEIELNYGTFFVQLWVAERYIIERRFKVMEPEEKEE